MSSVTEMRKVLDQLDRVSDEQWKNTLNERKRNELAFHDANRDRQTNEKLDGDTYEKFYGNKKYYTATDESRAYTQSWISAQAKGRIFLDYACGDGGNAIQAARAGAELSIGLDISPVSVENAKRDAAEAGVSGNTYFVQGDCENTGLPSNSVDRIICSGMLHHLDLSFAFPELRRILAPGGRILCVEALDYNPAIKLYRMMTPAMRTEWEKAHILSLKDLRFAERFFDIGEVKYWHITSIVGPHIRPMMPMLASIDRVLTRIPGVQLMAWIFTFELIKRQD